MPRRAATFRAKVLMPSPSRHYDIYHFSPRYRAGHRANGKRWRHATWPMMPPLRRYRRDDALLHTVCADKARGLLLLMSGAMISARSTGAIAAFSIIFMSLSRRQSAIYFCAESIYDMILYQSPSTNFSARAVSRRASATRRDDDDAMLASTALERPARGCGALGRFQRCRRFLLAIWRRRLRHRHGRRQYLASSRKKSMLPRAAFPLGRDARCSLAEY